MFFERAKTFFLNGLKPILIHHQKLNYLIGMDFNPFQFRM